MDLAKRAFFLLMVVALSAPLCAQDAPTSSLKGTSFAHWGYNRAWFTTSDIHFTGDDHAFTLHDVRAVDRPMPFGRAYFQPRNIWIPQYNYRAGHFFHERWSISLGLDHMKYVVQQGQTVSMEGHVDKAGPSRYTVEEGVRDVCITGDILTYEHTDGLNLLSVDLDHYEPLWGSTDDRFALRFYEGLHAGPVIPRTDVRLFGEGQNNRFNIAGLGAGAQVGFHFTFLRHFYLRNALKGGFITLPHVLTTGNAEDKARQHFWFLQHAIVLGGQFRIGGGGR